jgi:hypothetical protein
MTLLQAKCQLYHQLLLADPDHISDSDLNLMEALMKDPEIQQHLSKSMS